MAHHHRQRSARRLRRSKSRSFLKLTRSSRAQSREQLESARKSTQKFNQFRSLFAQIRPRDSRGRFLPLDFEFVLIISYFHAILCLSMSSQASKIFRKIKESETRALNVKKAKAIKESFKRFAFYERYFSINARAEYL